MARFQPRASRSTSSPLNSPDRHMSSRSAEHSCSLSTECRTRPHGQPRRMYGDSGKRTITAFDMDLDSGGIRGSRRFARFSAAQGTPDGMTVDADDNPWVALWRRRGGALRCVRNASRRHAAADTTTHCTLSCPDQRPNAILVLVATDVDDVIACWYVGVGADVGAAMCASPGRMSTGLRGSATGDRRGLGGRCARYRPGSGCHRSDRSPGKRRVARSGAP